MYFFFFNNNFFFFGFTCDQWRHPARGGRQSISVPRSGCFASVAVGQWPRAHLTQVGVEFLTFWKIFVDLVFWGFWQWPDFVCDYVTRLERIQRICLWINRRLFHRTRGNSWFFICSGKAFVSVEICISPTGGTWLPLARNLTGKKRLKWQWIDILEGKWTIGQKIRNQMVALLIFSPPALTVTRRKCAIPAGYWNTTPTRHVTAAHLHMRP